MEGVQALLAEPYGQPFDGGFVAERGIGVGRRVLWFGRILPDRAVHLKELFGLGVARLKIVIAERPARETPS